MTLETTTNGSRIDLLARLAERVGGTAQARSVFGDPIERDGVTVIPVARARWGFGGGGGAKNDEEGDGAGGGAVMNPVGWIEVTDEGSRFRSARDPVRSFIMLVGGGLLGLVMLRRLLR